MSLSIQGPRVAGGWLAAASLCLAVVFVFHGPPAPHVGDQMTIIANSSSRWLSVHWLASASLSSFFVAGLIILSSGSRLTESWWTLSAWAVLPVGSFWTMITAVAEATAVTDAAVTGNNGVFAAWWAFSEGMANGFAAVALAVAAIAANEVRAADSATPTWAAGVAIVAGLASFGGWATWSWADIGQAAPVWVGSSLLMCLWLAWFGVGLARSEAGLARVAAAE